MLPLRYNRQDDWRKFWKSFRECFHLKSRVSRKTVVTLWLQALFSLDSSPPTVQIVHSESKTISFRFWRKEKKIVKRRMFSTYFNSWRFAYARQNTFSKVAVLQKIVTAVIILIWESRKKTENNANNPRKSANWSKTNIVRHELVGLSFAIIFSTYIPVLKFFPYKNHFSNVRWLFQSVRCPS